MDEFRFINVFNNIRDVIQSVRVGYPSALIGGKNTPTSVSGDDIGDISLEPIAIKHSVRALKRFENMPQISSLPALVNWEEKHFHCLNYRPNQRGNVLDFFGDGGKAGAGRTPKEWSRKVKGPRIIRWMVGGGKRIGG